MSVGRPARAERFLPRTRPVVPPIHQSVTYFLDDLAYKDVQERGLDEVWYGRFRNPTVDVAAEEVRDRETAEAVLVVDSTFATPYNVQPLALGADVVVHYATKFLNGHSDAIAGVVAGPADLVREVQRRVITLGTCLDPHVAYLVWRGLQTFELRMARSNETARVLAAALAARDDVVNVRHPSVPGYERAEVAQRVLRRDGDVPRAGAMVSFTVEGGDERALDQER